ncbi:unnamed protein product [Acanthoscelides obtectus]|uniref:Uncharacterized protein n=1 Tax=Acanthoscelides obtectus TaxID=200917 RepID=A0A9P0M3W7_ACAOB|nr:unnamed protein product [Acanthoscelides obtectus]CAK1641272.1 hypothetical protein AOBTE_LOCUS12290 [Acanthoscelides obtectus]
MAFLQPHIKGRETHSNVTEISQDVSEDDDVETQVENNTQSQREDVCEYYDDEISTNLPRSISQPNTPLSCSSSVDISRPASRATSVNSVERSKKIKLAARNAE